MENLIEQQVEKNRRLINEGRMEGGMWALIGMTCYLILVAMVMEILL